MKQYFKLIILILLAMLCHFVSKNAYIDLKNMEQFTTFQNVGALVSNDYDDMLRVESKAKVPLDFVLWSQTDNISINSLGTGEQNVSCVITRGDTRILFPIYETLSDDDFDGCLIDSYTSKKLFKSTNAIGNIVKINGTEYTIRGIMDSPSKTIVIKEKSSNKNVLTNITVKGVDNTEEFLTRHSFLTATTVKSNIYTSIAHILYLIPLFAIIWVVFSILSTLRNKFKDYQVRYIFINIGILGVISCGILIILTIIPQALIPTQWSDFEFWRTGIIDFLFSITSFITSTKYRTDIRLLHMIFKSASGVLGACFIISIYNEIRITLKVI